MDVFSLMNMTVLQNARSGAELVASGQSIIPHGAIRRAAMVGPKRPPRLRRRRPQSKNCSNSKKSRAIERKRRRKLETTSDKDLKKQIRLLDEQLSLISARDVVVRQNAQGAAYNVMRVYFDRIVRGYDPIRYPQQADATLEFFHSAFLKDLKTNEFTGQDKYLEQWQLVNECHAKVGCKAASIDVYPLTDEHLCNDDEELGRYANVVKSCGATTLQISRTIERIFPHILTDEPLVQSLIGKTYSFAFTLIAYVDERDNRIFQTEPTVDLTSALLDMLQDPFVTVKMVDAAVMIMTKRGNLLLMDDIHEDQNVIENGFL